MGDLLGSPCADSSWISFLAYHNLFENKNFEEEEKEEEVIITNITDFFVVSIYKKNTELA